VRREQSPEAFPLALLIVVYCFAWIKARGVMRNVAVLVINFLLIFTGFGIFIAGNHPVVVRA